MYTNKKQLDYSYAKTLPGTNYVVEKRVYKAKTRGRYASFQSTSSQWRRREIMNSEVAGLTLTVFPVTRKKGFCHVQEPVKLNHL